MNMQMEHILASIKRKFVAQKESSTAVQQIHSAFEIEHHKERTEKIKELLNPAG